MSLCSSIEQNKWLLHHGRLVQSGTVKKLRRNCTRINLSLIVSLCVLMIILSYHGSSVQKSVYFTFFCIVISVHLSANFLQINLTQSSRLTSTSKWDSLIRYGMQLIKVFQLTIKQVLSYLHFIENMTIIRLI